MSIVVNGISKSYGEQWALNNVSLQLGKGEIIGLLGPNGAGKTTLMKIISCFMPPTLGTASVCGFSIADAPDEVRRRIGYLPEHNPLYYDMYVHEFLLFIANLHKLTGNKKKRVKDLIEITGLVPEQHKKIGMLSKGFRQRVGLAQAMIHDPEVLILDEPTSGLDPNQLVEIRSLIKSMGEDKTVLFSTHIMQEVEALCSRVVIINKGIIAADRPIQELSALATETEPLIVEFDKPTGIKHISSLPGVKFAKIVDEKTFHLETDPKVDVRSHVFQLASKEQLKVVTIARATRKLEEIFQLLTVNTDKSGGIEH